MSQNCPSCGYELSTVVSCSAWYMHDNHTFTRLLGDVPSMVAQARKLGIESPYGMLGGIRLFDHDEREVRTVGKSVHGRHGLPEDELQAWALAAISDVDVLRLVGGNTHGNNSVSTTTAEPTNNENPE
jgi:hypothetical protein